jgi:flagellar biogenesis protein FliO
MLDLWLVKLSNVITLGNMGAIATLIGGGIYFFYKIRRYISLQHYEYLKYIEQLEAQHKKQLQSLAEGINEKPGSSQ